MRKNEECGMAAHAMSEVSVEARYSTYRMEGVQVGLLSGIIHC